MEALRHRHQTFITLKIITGIKILLREADGIFSTVCQTPPNDGENAVTNLRHKNLIDTTFRRHCL